MTGLRIGRTNDTWHATCLRHTCHWNYHNRDFDAFSEEVDRHHDQHTTHDTQPQEVPC